HECPAATRRQSAFLRLSLLGDAAASAQECGSSDGPRHITSSCSHRHCGGQHSGKSFHPSLYSPESHRPRPAPSGQSEDCIRCCSRRTLMATLSKTKRGPEIESLSLSARRQGIYRQHFPSRDSSAGGLQ